MSSAASDDLWSAYRNHADRVAVVVLPVESPSEQEPDEAWVVLSHGAAWEQDWLVRQVHGLTLPGANKQIAADAPHILQVKENHFSWGADAAAVEIVLFLVQWAATSAAWDATKALARSMQRRLDGGRLTEDSRPLDETEAEARAKWIATTRWKVHEERLRLISIEVTPPASASVILADLDGWQYECDLIAIGGTVTTSRLKRSRRVE